MNTLNQLEDDIAQPRVHLHDPQLDGMPAYDDAHPYHAQHSPVQRASEINRSSNTLLSRLKQLLAPGDSERADGATPRSSFQEKLNVLKLGNPGSFVRQQPGVALVLSFCVGGLGAWLVSKRK